MNVLITGGAGYVGDELVYRLAAADNVDKIIIYDNLARSNYNLFTGLRKVPQAAEVKFVRGDILDSRKLRKLLENVDLVYHLAATVSTPYADQNSHSFEQTNHWGTAEMVYAIEDTGPKRVVYLSSMSVYGSGRTITSTDDPLNPQSYYGISKLRGEKHMQRLMEKMPVYIIRCANVYGYSKNLRVEAVINRMIFDAHFQNQVQIQGKGDQVRAFISIKRTVECLYRLLDTELAPGIYNLFDKNLSIISVADTLKEIYPTLDMLFVDQHLPVRDIRVEPDERIMAIMQEGEQSLRQDLLDFKQMFTF
jgi:UDP-glucose 4-epimerase